MKFPDTIEECHALIRQLLVIIEGMQREVDELKSKVNQNSRNSSRPPSSDGLKKPAIPKPKGGNKGGQKGHKGKTLKMVEHPDETVDLRPEVCSGCGAVLGAGLPMELLSKRQVFDLPPIRLRVVEYQRYECTCQSCGQSNTADFPRGVVAPVQYGSQVKALVTLLHQNGCMPVGKIQTLFEDLFDQQINEATIMECQQTAYRQLEPEEVYTKEQLEQEKVVHADESGIRCEGRLHWLHEIGSERFTYQFVHTRRGIQAHQDPEALLPRLRQWLVHDCWAPYFGLKECRHALCVAHLLRELNALQEQGRKWAARFHAFLLDLYTRTQKGRDQLPLNQHPAMLRKYNLLLKAGYAEEPPPQKNARGKPKKSKGLNLLERLDLHWEAVLAFACHKEVPFTNNLAERDIRPAKSKIKIAGTFRSLDGANAYARINSFISTVRKQQYNPFKELVNVFDGSTPSYRVAGW